jgi:hypothetical protein
MTLGVTTKDENKPAGRPHVISTTYAYFRRRHQAAIAGYRTIR